MKRPNVIFILSDDHGAWAMRCAGNSDIITPNLDRIAEKGILFENFFCASPVCSPARASIVTGEMPSCHGVHDWLCGGNADTVKYPNMKDHPHFKNVDKPIEYLDGHPSYVAQLAKQGYRCGLSGKWHLGNSATPKDGFEKWFTIFGGGCDYYNPDTFENGEFKNETRYVTDVITDKALEHLEDFLKDDENPFYLSVHYTAPHTPWTAENHPDEYLDLYFNNEFKATPDESVHFNQINTCFVGGTPQRRKESYTGYYAAITAMDDNVGRILDRIEASGQADNTIVIFTGDNGMNLGHHGIWGKGNGTYPPNMYDTSVKVPCLIYSPTLKKGGVVEKALLSQCDFYPTLLELAGANVELSDKQPGRSFAKILKGEEIEDHDELVICDEYGFVRMLRNKTHKLVMEYPDGRNQFYDLVNDPNEDINEYYNEKYADLINEMTTKLENWFDRYSTGENDAKNNPVTGRGQYKLCTEDDAFKQSFEYYYKT